MDMRFISTTVPNERIKNLYADNYRITQILFHSGDSMTMEYLGGGLAKDIASRHIQLSGIRVCEGGVMPPMVAGSMTQYDTYEIPPGVYTRTATEDSELWCLRDANNETADIGLVDSIKLEPNQSLSLNTGDRAFLIYGRATVGQQIFTPPRLLVASGPRTITAIDGIVYLFKWPAPMPSS